MNTMTEDTLVQQTTADYLLNNLHWDESIYGMKEVLGKEGTLGRESEQQMVLTRYLGEALMRLNPDLPDEAYRDAMRQILSFPRSSVGMHVSTLRVKKLRVWEQ